VSAERVQKFLARAGVASRRHAEELIAEGRVTVNGKTAGLGDKVDPAQDAVKVDGKRVQPRKPGTYLALYKPRAVMSTVADPEGRPTVLDLVPRGLRRALVPVGRLDFLTEGLILLTDDGEFAQRVAHPRYGCRKTYEVKVRGGPAERDLDKLRAGIVLEGRRTAPARITARQVPARARKGRGGDDETGDNTWWTVELTQGRTRQVREMFQRIGHPVMKLRRVAIGTVTAGGLGPGDLRPLSEREVESLRRASAPTEAGEKPPRVKRPRAKAPGEKGPRRPPKREAGSRVGKSGKEEGGRPAGKGGPRRSAAGTRGRPAGGGKGPAGRGPRGEAEAAGRGARRAPAPPGRRTRGGAAAPSRPRRGPGGDPRGASGRPRRPPGRGGGRPRGGGGRGGRR
jgi:23S rRNA pseudouridine2605 synthase